MALRSKRRVVRRIALYWVAALLGVAATAYGQHASHKISDAEIVKISLSAAPKAIAKDATVIDIGADGKVRVVRQGKGEWTCMPGQGNPKAPDPMCGDKNAMARSEEHTSELQSPDHIVCRLLLEKKNTDRQATRTSSVN